MPDPSKISAKLLPIAAERIKNEQDEISRILMPGTSTTNNATFEQTIYAQSSQLTDQLMRQFDFYTDLSAENLKQSLPPKHNLVALARRTNELAYQLNLIVTRHCQRLKITPANGTFINPVNFNTFLLGISTVISTELAYIKSILYPATDHTSTTDIRNFEAYVFSQSPVLVLMLTQQLDFYAEVSRQDTGKRTKRTFNLITFAKQANELAYRLNMIVVSYCRALDKVPTANQYINPGKMTVSYLRSATEFASIRRFLYDVNQHSTSSSTMQITSAPAPDHATSNTRPSTHAVGHPLITTYPFVSQLHTIVIDETGAQEDTPADQAFVRPCN